MPSRINGLRRVEPPETVDYDVCLQTWVRLIACLSALEQLRLDRLYVVHAGRERFPLAKGTEAMPLADLARED